MAVANGTAERTWKVDFLGKSTSRGNYPVKPGKTHPLSPLDRAMASHSLHLVFYFPPAAVSAAGIKRDTLRAAISELIMHYPAMAGRLISPDGPGGDLIIKCNDTGIRVLDARVHADLSDWLASAPPELERDLARCETPGEDVFLWSPFTFQLTQFACGGFTVGLGCSHLVADPTCAALIVKALADCHRRACISHPPFFFPPALRPPPDRTPNPEVSVSLLQAKSATTPPPAVPFATTTFRFSDDAVGRCLARSGASSPFAALAGLFWWRAGSTSVTLARDFRKLLRAPLPHGYFGNAVLFETAEAEVDGGWEAAAAAVGNRVSGFDEDEVWATIDWLQARNGAEAFQMYGPELTCVNLEGLFLYDVAFGADVVPCHVACHVGGVAGEGIILVLPAPPELGPLGQTVTIAMREEQMARIRRDPVILELGPTLLFPSS